MDCKRGFRGLAQSSSTESRLISTPTSWLRQSSGSGTSSGCATTASASRTPPILKPLETIILMDALLAYDDDGEPAEPLWPEAEMIIGNPAFLGGKRLRTEL